jgi:hypothetical protein
MYIHILLLELHIYIFIYKYLLLLGSVLKCDKEILFSVERKGIPGIWIKNVINGSVDMKLVPSEGKTSYLFRLATSINKDKRVELCRRFNPTPLYMNKKDLP